MNCTVCDCDINYGEDFRQHETNKEEICMNPDCLYNHMLEHITLFELEEYSAGEPNLQEQITMNGLNSLSGEEKKCLTEWYEQFYYTFENDEPDDTLVAEWVADRAYLNSYYASIRC